VVDRKAAVAHAGVTEDKAEAYSTPAADNFAGTVGRWTVEGMEAAEYREMASAEHWDTVEAVPPDLMPYRNYCRTFYQVQPAPNN